MVLDAATSGPESPSIARWLLERADGEGLPLTKTGALGRVVVREAAERWPHPWNHELFGPPHRELEVPALGETHEALRRLRLLRRRKDRVLITARGRELAADPDALVQTLHDQVDVGDRSTPRCGRRSSACWSRCMSPSRWTSSWNGCGPRCCSKAGATTTE